MGPNGRGRAMRRALLAGLLLYVATWLTNRSLRVVEGDSMRPTLRPGDRLLVVPLPGAALRNGHVVVVRDPRRPDLTTVKRVTAVAGEPVPGVPGATVPPGHLFVQGDNRAASTDSITYGPVPFALVARRAVLRLSPLRFLGGGSGALSE